MLQNLKIPLPENILNYKCLDSATILPKTSHNRQTLTTPTENAPILKNPAITTQKTSIS